MNNADAINTALTWAGSLAWEARQRGDLTTQHKAEDAKRHGDVDALLWVVDTYPGYTRLTVATSAEQEKIWQLISQA